MSESQIPGIAVLASGSGSTLETFVHATQESIANAEVGLVISDKENAGVFGRVARLNSLYNLDIQTRVINGKLYPKGGQERGQTLQEAEKICSAVGTGEFTLVALMGYMRVIAPEGDLMKEFGWLPEYRQRDPATRGIFYSRMLNTHHGILPATAGKYGIGIDKRILELGARQSAHTVQVVAAKVDTGPVFQSNPFPVYPETDTPELVMARAQRVEQAHLPIDIDRFLKEQQKFHEGTSDG